MKSYLAALTALLVALPVGAQTECPEISGEYVLTGDLVCDTSLYLPSDTTLDLNGFTLTADVYVGDPEPGSYGADNVTLTNGTVVMPKIEWSSCSNCLIDGVHVIGEFGNGSSYIGGGTVIRNSRLTRIGFDFYHSGGHLIEGNVFEHSGISLYDSGENTIRRNSFVPGAVGIWNEDRTGGSFNRIEGNLFFMPGWDAISISIDNCFYEAQQSSRIDCVEGNVIAHNVIVGTGREGILVTSELDCRADDSYSCAIHAGALIEGNVLIHNGLSEDDSETYDAIRIIGVPEVADGFVLRNNRVAFSGNHAIYAPGVTDGGGNQAIRSGNPDECIGVDCDPQARRGPRTPLRCSELPAPCLGAQARYGESRGRP